MTSACSQTPAEKINIHSRSCKALFIYQRGFHPKSNVSAHISFIPPPPSLSHPVSGEHLSSVLVLDLDDSRWLDPGLTIHLNGNPLITQDGDLHCSTLIRAQRYIKITHVCTVRVVSSLRVVFSVCSHLSYAVVLQLDDSGHSHLHTSKHGHHFEDLIVKRWGAEDLHNTVITLKI